MTIFINPSDDDAISAFDQHCNLIKSIIDASGNLYLWDGEEFEHQQIMGRYGIPEELYCTANRFYKDHGGEQQLSEHLNFWRSCIKGRSYVDGVWLL